MKHDQTSIGKNLVHLLLTATSCVILPSCFSAQENSQLSPNAKITPIIYPINQTPSPRKKQPIIKAPISSPNHLEEILPPLPLAGKSIDNFLDIRGVGDAAMAITHRQPVSLNQKLPQGVLANFGQRLDNFDPSGKSYRGDLTYINWETTVGLKCDRFWAKLGPRSFAFITHPDHLISAYQKGFNLIGLANNHARDCPISEQNNDGAAVSSQHLARLTKEQSANWLWHGVGTQKTAQVRTMNIKGQAVKIAFASLYIAGGNCTYVTCIKDEETVLTSLRDADADLKILALHSWNNQTQKQLVQIGTKFIKSYDGDLVFGSGPHRYAPVRIVTSNTGKKGVLFDSLGNFIHPALVPNSQHIIGRVLFDLENRQLRQIQIIPISVNRVNVNFKGSGKPSVMPSSLKWELINDQSWSSGVRRGIRGYYVNVN